MTVFVPGKTKEQINLAGASGGGQPGGKWNQAGLAQQYLRICQRGRLMKTGAAEKAQMLLQLPREDANLLAMPPIGQTYTQARGKGLLGNKVFNEIA